jgi:electron transfer flavoprotein alpha subunit
MADGSGVLVLAETAEGKPTPLTGELLGLAGRLAGALGGKTSAVLLGSQVGQVGQDLVAQGADKVYVADNTLFADYQADAWLPVVGKIARDSAPAVILIGHTPAGADLAPRLAFRLGTTVATACVKVEVVGERLLLTRPCYGGNAREVVSFRTCPAIATIKAKSQEAGERDDRRAGDVVKVEPGLSPAMVRTRICDRRKESGQGSRLEKANVVVSGGRGLNGPEGFKMAQELARLLDGAVGASRVACDLGWCPPSYQIGLSGRTVAPELYIALGISGAGQHMAGCAGAKNIISVNTDADAEIFKFSRFGVVGDCRKILPSLIEEIRKFKS